ncbi:MAG: type II toxin-antitoxin system RelE/ParE family toxin [Methylovirgula sp.]
MIRSFADQQMELLFTDGKVPAQWRSFSKVAARKLDMVDATAKLEDLRSPPGNRLERLKGNRAGRHSIPINDQWRVCFRWTEVGPADVEIVDYH